MTRINTNIPSLVAQKTLARSNAQLQVALTRLSTGLRINTGKDDPAGLIASEVLRSDITGTQKAISNSERANQLISTADSALGQVSSLLNDIRGLVSEAANTGALSDDQIAANQLQVDASLESIDRIARVTQFQGRRLLDGSLDFINTAPGNVTNNSTAAVSTLQRAEGTVSGGSANSDIVITAVTGGTAGNVTVRFIDGATAGAEAVSVTNGELVVQIQSGSSTANQIISAIVAQSSQFSARTAAVGTGAFTASFISGASASAIVTGATAGTDSIRVSSESIGTSGNIGIRLISGTVTAGSETATLASNVLTVTIDSGTSTGAQIVSAINAQITGFSAVVLSGAGTGVFNGGVSTSAAGGTIDSVRRSFSLASGGTGGLSIISNNAGDAFNGVTIRLSSGGTAGSETVSYDAVNKILNVTIEDGISTAAQVASAINADATFSATIDSGTYSASFLSATSTAATTSGGYSEAKVQNLEIQQATFGTQTAIAVTVDVDSQARQARLTYSGGALLAPVTVRIAGAKGSEVRTFGAASTLDSIATAINTVSDSTGVSARVASGTTTNDLILTSTEYGSKAFVDVEAINGSNFTTYNSGGSASSREVGTDVRARVNGVAATAEGLDAAINTSTLDLSFRVSSRLNDGDSVTFTITGGGANFQLGPNVVSNQQARIGIAGVSTATLGGTSGTLYELRSGGTKNLASDATGAGAIIEEVINKVTSLRGRLGAFQKTTLETNINTLNDTLENLTAAESSIRDADFATESASLTRAQILVQSGTSVLSIANQNPQNVLSLLR